MTRIIAPRSARNKMMDLLAIRDHSEKEIRQKLKQRKFSEEEIDKAVEYGRTHHWLPETADENTLLSQRFADSLHRKGKGVIYINHQLAKKGLPAIAADSQIELEKALRLLDNKQVKKDLDKNEKAKLGRFLVSRGFELQIVRKALHEKFRG